MVARSLAVISGAGAVADARATLCGELVTTTYATHHTSHKVGIRYSTATARQ